ncbi:MAG: hypothetical protein ACYDCJ_03060 [Gammaproteobacteria bacterium]
MMQATKIVLCNFLPQRLLIAIAFIIPIVGCIPVSGQYYHVSASEGKEVGSGRGNLTGPPDALEFFRSNVRVVIGPTTGGTRVGQFLVIQLWVPPDDTVRLNLNQMRLYDKNSADNLSTEPPLGYVLKNKGFVSLKSFGVLAGSKYVNKIYKTSVFRIEVKFDHSMPPEFIFNFPNAYVNGVLYPGMKITYEKRYGVWSSPIND